MQMVTVKVHNRMGEKSVVPSIYKLRHMMYDVSSKRDGLHSIPTFPTSSPQWFPMRHLFPKAARRTAFPASYDIL